MQIASEGLAQALVCLCFCDAVPMCNSMPEATPLSKMLGDSKMQAALFVVGAHANTAVRVARAEEAALKLMLMLTDAGVSQPGSDIGTEAGFGRTGLRPEFALNLCPADDRWWRCPEPAGLALQLRLPAPGMALCTLAGRSGSTAHLDEWKEMSAAVLGNL